MTATLVLRVAPAARLAAAADSIVLVNGRDEYRIEPVPLALRRAILMLDGAGATEQDLAAAFDGKGADALLAFHGLLGELTARGHVARALVIDGAPVATLVTIGSTSDPVTLEDAAPAVLSRFAYLRREGGRFVLESARSDSQLILENADAAALLMRAAGADDGSAVSAARDETTRLLIDLLRRGRFLSACDGPASEDSDAALAHWEFHDLVFHSRSRLGRHRNPYGAVFPFRDRFAPLAALPEAPGRAAVVLDRPDLSEIQAHDAPFTAVLERRRSVREPGAAPISVRQLGEFLYRAARVRCVEAGRDYEISSRVYPGGGAAYELEIYPAVNRCDRLHPGLYHYDAANHGLEPVRDDADAKVTRLLTTAATMANAPAPDVLLVLAARFRRVSWKYRSMAYAGILKDVGALYQTFYLVAAAMGLAPCALGGGNSDLFAELAGTSCYEETSVGEFMISGGG